jgi:hypothetical protein
MERINHLAVILAAVAFFILGFVWYALLFGSMWSKLANYTPHSTGLNPMVMVATFVLDLIMAYIIGIALAKAADTTAKDGIQFGLFMSLGLVAAFMLIGYLNTDKPFALWLIDAGYGVVGITLMSAIIGGWKKRAATP